MRTRIVVHGRVQGVGFRYAVQRTAASRGISGWVRNRADGTVEAVFDGEPEAVEALVRYCRQGPRAAGVERVEVGEAPDEPLMDFRVR